MPAPRHCATALVLAAATCLATHVLPSLAAGSPAQPQPTTVVRLAETFPNYWSGFPSPPPGGNLSLISTTYDVVHGWVVEYNGTMCDGAKRGRLEVYEAGSHSSLGSDATSCGPQSAATNANSKAPVMAIDDADSLLFVAGQQVQPIVYLYSLPSLRAVGSLQLPATDPNQKVGGLSWSDVSNELIVVTTNLSAGGTFDPAPVETYAFDAAALARGAGTTPIWSYLVKACQHTLSTYFATANPYLSGDGKRLFMPCQLVGGTSNVEGTAPDADGVVRVELGHTDSLGTACPRLCPTGQEAAAVAPALTNDFLFDPVSDRGFMPAQTTSGISLLVYDGSSNSFLGRAKVASGFNNLGLSLDATTGRVYALGPDGLSLVDGRRTPLGPGVLYKEFGTALNYVAFATLPADATHRYARLLVPIPLPGKPDTVDDLTVLADGVAVGVNPPAAAVDGNTHQGAIPSGATVSTHFGGDARGYGTHVDNVGGPKSLVLNATFGNGAVPFSASPDLLNGAVSTLNLRDRSAQGDASSLVDGNGSTSFSLAQCTSSSPQGLACAPPPPGVPSVPQAGPTPPTTTQTEVAPHAVCAQPSGSAPTSSASGYQYTTYTTGTDGRPVAQQNSVPGSSSAGGASVDCTTGAVIRGLGTSQGFSVAGATNSSGTDPTVDIGPTRTETSVQPPAGTAGILAAATASASGIHVSLGPAGGFDVGSVVQHATAFSRGQAGTAGTSDEVTLQNVTLTKDGVVQQVCAGTCADPGAAAATISAAFPAVLSLTLPAPDATYLHGSPGGYLAAVQAALVEQYGDEQFNGMRPEEAAFHPALRLVLYSVGDGQPAVSQTVVDFAGVNVDATVGIEVFPAPSASDFIGITNGSAVGAAGIPSRSSFIPGTQGTAATSAPGGGSSGDLALPADTSGTVEVDQQTFDGLRWFRHGPAAAIQMFGFLGLLGLPFVVMRRRWSWPDTTEETNP